MGSVGVEAVEHDRSADNGLIHRGLEQLFEVANAVRQGCTRVAFKGDWVRQFASSSTSSKQGYPLRLVHLRPTLRVNADDAPRSQVHVSSVSVLRYAKCHCCHFTSTFCLRAQLRLMHGDRLLTGCFATTGSNRGQNQVVGCPAAAANHLTARAPVLGVGFDVIQDTVLINDGAQRARSNC